MQTRRTRNVDRDPAGQVCTKESVLMQMSQNRRARKETAVRTALGSQCISRDVVGLSKGIIIALPPVNEGP